MGPTASAPAVICTAMQVHTSNGICFLLLCPPTGTGREVGLVRDMWGSSHRGKGQSPICLHSRGWGDGGLHRNAHRGGAAVPPTGFSSTQTHTVSLHPLFNRDVVLVQQPEFPLQTIRLLLTFCQCSLQARNVVISGATRACHSITTTTKPSV